MKRSNEPNLLTEFLGAAAAAGGPFEILGLDRSVLTDTQILDARDRRIADLDNHPLAHTPEADEVRLAIHAAAANLLDPRIRASLMAPPTGGIPDNPPTPPPTRPRTPPDTARAFERDALVTIGMHGGWGALAQRRIAMLAHWHRISPAAVAATLARLRIHGSQAQRQGSRARPRSIQPSPEQSLMGTETDQIDDVWRIVAGAGIAVVLSAIILSTLVIVIVRADGSPESPDTERIQSAQTPSLRDNTREQKFIPKQRTDLEAANVISHELRSAAAAAEARHPDASDRFRSAARSLALAWSDYTPGSVRAANEAAIAYVTVSDASAAEALGFIESLGHPLTPNADDLTAALWADGMMAFARNTPSLSRASRDRIAEYFARLGHRPADSTFAGGVRAGLHSRIQSLAPSDADAWQSWTGALSRAGVSSPDVQGQVGIAALDYVLRHPDAPPRSVLGSLVGTLSWREGSDARAWLLEQFDAADVRTPSLAALLTEIAESSAAPDVVPDMTLHRSASLEDRAAMRRQYAAAWGFSEQPGPDDVIAAAVRRELAAAVEHASDARTTLQRMRALVQLARANALAARLLAGDADSVVDELALNLDRLAEVEHAPESPGFDVNAPIPDDGFWGAATRAIDPDDDTRIISAVTEIRGRAGPIGPADAGVLARLAFRGSGTAIRAEAARSLVVFSESPHALLSVIDLLDAIPRNETNARVLESLTRRVVWTDSRDEFYPNARTALLERTLELIASGSDEALTDRYAALLGRYYHWAGSGESIDADAPPAAVSASLLASKIRAGSPAPANRDHPWTAGRPTRLMSHSPAARFLTEQTTLARVLATSAVAERSSLDARVRSAWRSLARSDNNATDMLDQIIAAEHTLAVLWQLRMESGGTAP